GAHLSFEDLMVQGGLRSPDSVRYRYRVLDGKGTYALTPWIEFSSPTLAVERGPLDEMKEGKAYRLQLQAMDEEKPYWGPSIDLILQKERDVRLMGLFRRY